MGNSIPRHTRLILPNGQGHPPITLNDPNEYRAVSTVWQVTLAAIGLGMVALSVLLA